MWWKLLYRARAVATKFHKWNGLNNKTVFFIVSQF
jgi:hypothetical protein